MVLRGAWPETIRKLYAKEAPVARASCIAVRVPNKKEHGLRLKDVNPPVARHGEQEPEKGDQCSALGLPSLPAPKGWPWLNSYRLSM
jgi:hypothetical protein